MGFRNKNPKASSIREQDPDATVRSHVEKKEPESGNTSTMISDPVRAAAAAAPFQN